MSGAGVKKNPGRRSEPLTVEDVGEAWALLSPTGTRLGVGALESRITALRPGEFLDRTALRDEAELMMGGGVGDTLSLATLEAILVGADNQIPDFDATVECMKVLGGGGTCVDRAKLQTLFEKMGFGSIDDAAWALLVEEVDGDNDRAIGMADLETAMAASRKTEKKK